MSEYIAEFNAITYAEFFKQLTIGGILSVLASLTSMVVEKHKRLIAKFIVASFLIVPAAIYFWWKYMTIPRFFSERSMAWEVGAKFGPMALITWWIAPLITTIFVGKAIDKKRAVIITFSLLIGFFVGGIHSSRRGGGPVFPIHGFIIGTIVFGLIGVWIGYRKKPDLEATKLKSSILRKSLKMISSICLSLVSQIKKLKLRARILWIPGIVIIAIGIFIPIRKAWLLRHFKYVSKHAVACKLNVDLSKEGINETSFTPMVTRTFVLSFNLHTLRPDSSEESSAQDIFQSNPIEKALEIETFELSWSLCQGNQTIASGMISEKDLKNKVGALDISYRFAPEYVFLRKGRNYTLVVEVEKPSPVLAAFRPELVIRTWASLKGYSLVRWKMRDTLLCLTLGTVLIIAGLIKRCTS